MKKANLRLACLLLVYGTTLLQMQVRCTTTVNPILHECEQDLSYCKNKVEHSHCHIEDNGDADCACDEGYIMNKTSSKVMCEECAKGAWGWNCSKVCSCNITTTDGCDLLRGDCICQAGWHGDNCDLNECVQNSSFCTAFPNAHCENTAGPAYCACDAGYFADHTNLNNTICEECLSGTWGVNCNQNCTCKMANTEFCDPVNGSCTCKTGWEGVNCTVDVDECLRNNSFCTWLDHSVCRNTQGSAVCPCEYGYFAKRSGSSVVVCEDCPDWQWGWECDNNCACVKGNTQACDKANGTCTCMTGWEGDDCASDVDECARNYSYCHELEHSYCHNTQGSASCLCVAGYIIKRTGPKDVACLGCKEWTWGLNCANNCTCHQKNTDRCDATNGSCVCKAGWEGDNCTVDVDECSLDASFCASLQDSSCLNTVGGAECVCDIGHRPKRIKPTDVVCEECEEGTWGLNCNNTCRCEINNTQTCDKVNGTCICKPGWEKDDCSADANQCQDVPDLCNDMEHSHCQNTGEDASCFCNSGYSKVWTSRESVTCKECQPWTWGSECVNNCTCNTTNTLACDKATGVCRCKISWTGSHCETFIDECATNPTFCQFLNHSHCQNTALGSECLCDDGYVYQRLSPTSMACVECEDLFWGQNCSTRCICETYNTERCDNFNGKCICQPAWEGKSCSTDRNECQEVFNYCAILNNSYCENLVGEPAECWCLSGYMLTRTGATTMDCVECPDWAYGEECGGNCSCNREKTKSCDKDSGYCYCHDGWAGDDCSADDNECADEPDLCEAADFFQCINTIGSYHCACQVGYYLPGGEMEDGCFACGDMWTWGDNCTHNCTCVHDNTEECNTVTGSCLCRPRWTGRNCESLVDECAEQPSLCSVFNSHCQNTVDGPVCVCDPGYYNTTLDTELNCEPCLDWTWGEKCSFNCTCDIDRTSRCEQENGTCTCTDAWTGANCTEDLDECTKYPDFCEEADNLQCVNTIGSYTCVCDVGYAPINGRLDEGCDACIDWTWGENCSHNCTCVEVNTSECDTVTGQCVCSSNWMGRNCETVVDECSTNPTFCSKTAHTHCQSTPTGPICVCDRGFANRSIGVIYVCEDCYDWTWGDNCAETCPCIRENSGGCDTITGRCICAYTWTGAHCENKACLGWTWGESCASNCTCDTNKTAKCEPGNGFCACENGWTGDNCTEDLDECTVYPDFCEAEDYFHCVNTFGSYQCVCDVGYILIDGELDEGCDACVGWTWGENCIHNCTCVQENTNECDTVTGQCLCSSKWTGQNCETLVNECSPDLNLCGNTPHSYCQSTPAGPTCVCDHGYINKSLVIELLCEECPDWTWGKDCNSSCTCLRNRTQNCDPETGDCICEENWTGLNCEEDVDECTLYPVLCHDLDFFRCQNTQGSYTCVCEVGYFIPSNGYKCEACESWMWGDKCANNCSCIYNNTNSCDKLTGFCHCKTGWSGNNCEIDLIECAQELDFCNTDAHSHCYNTTNGPSCVCDDGYVNKGTNAGVVCEECEDWTWGKSCVGECTCVNNHTHDCDAVNGECHCYWGWQGYNCERDMDECSTVPGFCQDLSHSHCHNTPGSASCDCDDGYFKSGFDVTEQCVETSVVNITLIFSTASILPSADASHNMMIQELEQGILTKLKLAGLNVLYATITDIKDLPASSSITFPLEADCEIGLNKTSGLEGLVIFFVKVMASSDVFVLNHQSIHLSQITVDGNQFSSTDSACQIKQKINPCPEGSQCVWDGTVTVCKLKEEDTNNLAVGLGVGLFLFAILFTVLGVITFCQTKKPTWFRQYRTRASTLFRWYRATEVERDNIIEETEDTTIAEYSLSYPFRRDDPRRTSGTNTAYENPLAVPEQQIEFTDFTSSGPELSA